MVGDVYGRLTVLSESSRETPSKGRRRIRKFCVCRCECGKEKEIDRDHLRTGHTKSCGCLHTESVKKTMTTHGATVSRRKGEYNRAYGIWGGITDRCTNVNNHAYKDYGGRGITVCDRWRSFENFFADMGNPPAGMTIDRADNDKGYCKENCRWASRKEQGRNRRSTVLLTHNGRTMCMKAWAEEMGMCGSAIRHRLNIGWSVEKALTAPNRYGTSRKGK